ncbi:hypothetical protein [Saccharopolyspora sp. 5N708]|uniref:hypothetical protein n=1 Tax=Saccharopolyspora sp. 5N708 TaxID=3457424 RepID=UPI003FCF219D
MGGQQTVIGLADGRDQFRDATGDVDQAGVEAGIVEVRLAGQGQIDLEAATPVAVTRRLAAHACRNAGGVAQQPAVQLARSGRGDDRLGSGVHRAVRGTHSGGTSFADQDLVHLDFGHHHPAMPFDERGERGGQAAATALGRWTARGQHGDEHRGPQRACGVVRPHPCMRSPRKQRRAQLLGVEPVGDQVERVACDEPLEGQRARGVRAQLSQQRGRLGCGQVHAQQGEERTEMRSEIGKQPVPCLVFAQALQFLSQFVGIGGDGNAAAPRQ